MTQSSAPQTFRVEKDSMGEVKVPTNALYQAQTQRAVRTLISTRAWYKVTNILHHNIMRRADRVEQHCKHETCVHVKVPIPVSVLVAVIAGIAGCGRWQPCAPVCSRVLAVRGWSGAAGLTEHPMKDRIQRHHVVVDAQLRRRPWNLNMPLHSRSENEFGRPRTHHSVHGGWNPR